jgi:hypothetical protein
MAAAGQRRWGNGRPGKPTKINNNALLFAAAGAVVVGEKKTLADLRLLCHIRFPQPFKSKI